MLSLARVKLIAGTAGVAVVLLSGSIIAAGVLSSQVPMAAHGGSTAGPPAVTSAPPASLVADLASTRAELTRLRSESVTFTELDHCGVLDIAHEAADKPFIFNDRGQVSDEACALFHLTASERSDLQVVLSQAHKDLAAALNSHGGHVTRTGDLTVIEFPALGAAGDVLSARTHQRLLALLGPHRGSLAWHILNRYWDDCFLGFAVQPQSLTIHRQANGQSEYKHQCSLGIWTRDYAVAPWKYALFTSFMVNAENSETKSGTMAPPQPGF